MNLCEHGEVSTIIFFVNCFRPSLNLKDDLNQTAFDHLPEDIKADPEMQVLFHANSQKMVQLD